MKESTHARSSVARITIRGGRVIQRATTHTISEATEVQVMPAGQASTLQDSAQNPPV